VTSKREELLGILEEAEGLGLPAPVSVLLQLFKDENPQILIPQPEYDIPIFSLVQAGLVPPPRQKGLTLLSDGWERVSSSVPLMMGGGGGVRLPTNAVGWLHNDGIGGLAWTTPAGGVADHALLNNLAYAASGHIGFQAALAFPLAPNLGGTGVANLAASTLTLGAATTITGGGILALGGFTGTVPATANFAMGAGALSNVTVGDATIAAHTHAITGFEPVDATIVRTGQANWIDLTDGGGTILHTHAYEPIDATIVRTGQANWIDLTDGGSTNLHIHPASAPAQHDIVGALHSVTGAAGQLVGLSALNTLGLVSPSPSMLGNGAMQYQTIITGANPFTPVYSGFLLDGTTGGKTVFAVTNAKTLTLTSTGDFNLTIPATGTAARTQDKLSAFAATTSAELAGVISDESGSGSAVFATRPTLTNAAETCQLLSDAASVVWNTDLGTVAYVKISGSRVIANPTNFRAGGHYVLYIQQDITGGWQPTWGTAYLWNDNKIPVVNTLPFAMSVFGFISDGTYLFGTTTTPRVRGLAEAVVYLGEVITFKGEIVYV